GIKIWFLLANEFGGLEDLKLFVVD
ncbi:hypothetical protein LCGC14_2893790, partial [marine sediment metagenome]